MFRIKNKKFMKKKNAFTLVEVIVVLTTLGIVAMMVIPSLLRHHTEIANRAKVKKSMSAYEKALNTMIIGNDLRSNSDIRTFGGFDLGENNTCKETRLYFKIIEDGKVGETANSCRFKTSDKVWWDISDITNPIIILKNDQNLETDTVENLQILAQDLTDKTVYAMVGHYEETTGILRVNDNAYEQSKGTAEHAKEVEKLYGLINPNRLNLSTDGDTGEVNQQDSEPVEPVVDNPTPPNVCTGVENGGTCDINGITYRKITPSSDVCVYDDPLEALGYPSDSNCVRAGETFYIMPAPVDLSKYENYSSDCELIDSHICREEGEADLWAAAKYYCEHYVGGQLATLGQLSAAGYTDGHYWSSATGAPDYAYVLSNNVVYSAQKNDGSGYNVVCVGKVDE